MVSPHCVIILSEATAGRNSVTKAPRRLASTRTITEARGKMLAGSSRQYQGAGQCGDKIGDSGKKKIGFRRFQRNARVQTSLRPPKSALPHRCALVRSSASAQHVPSRPDCIPRTFRDRAIRCCRFWVSHPKIWTLSQSHTLLLTQSSFCIPPSSPATSSVDTCSDSHLGMWRTPDATVRFAPICYVCSLA